MQKPSRLAAGEPASEAGFWRAPIARGTVQVVRRMRARIEPPDRFRSARSRVAVAATLASITLGLAPAGARADEAKPAGEARAARELAPSSARFVGTLALGRGMRFNNPYRLRTELGSDARSLSLTAPYLDLGVAAALGPPDGLQHGAAVRMSFALSGVGQAVLAPTYFAAYRGAGRLLAYGRLGPTILLGPDPNLGAEASLGAAWFFTAGIGAGAELVFDLYEGAPTRDAAHPILPILSAQLGLVVDYEVLP
jgi:hypothetical protein